MPIVSQRRLADDDEREISAFAVRKLRTVTCLLQKRTLASVCFERTETICTENLRSKQMPRPLVRSRALDYNQRRSNLRAKSTETTPWQTTRAGASTRRDAELLAQHRGVPSVSQKCAKVPGNEAQY